MRRRAPAILVVGVVATLAGYAGTRPASAAPPVVTPQQSQPYSNTTGVEGWPDPNGPPAPVCTGPPAQTCDREQFQLQNGTSPATDVFTLTVTVTYANNNTTPDGPNCLDIAIEDSSASTVLAKASCAPTGASITDPNVTIGTTYTVEVDGDAVNGVAAPAQPFSYVVSATAKPPAAGPTPTPAPNPSNVFSFTHQVSVDVQHGDGEPDVAIDPQDSNTMFSAAPWGFSTTVSLLWRSIDGGVQWNNLHGAATSDIPPCPDPVAVTLRPDCSRGGGDAEVQFSQPAGSNSTPRVQFEDLNGLDSISCAYSDNLGNTFTDLTNNGTAGAACDEGTSSNATNCAQEVQKPSAGCASLGTDRQWLQVWPAADQPASGNCGGGGSVAAVPCRSSDQLFMTFDTGDQPPSGDAAITSENNGASWILQCSTTSGPSCVGGPTGVGSRPGPLVIDPRLVQLVGGVSYPTLYEFMGTNSNGTEVNISCDGGQSWNNVSTSNGLAGSTTNDFVAGAMDSGGELYTTFSVANDPNPWRVWFNHSVVASAKLVGNCSQPVQATWATPSPLTGPPSSADNVGATPIPSETYAVMPWIAAGGPGRVDLVYYGTEAPVGLSPDTSTATWHLHMAQSLDGGGTWTDEQATETPMHLESICFSGIGCSAQTPPGGDRNLLDFFQVKIDSSGRAVIIYADDANSARCAPTCTQGIGLISEVQQATGPSLSGGTLSAPTSALSQSLDVRVAGANADITRNESTESVVPSTGNNVTGTADPAADITDLKVCLTGNVVCPVTNTTPNTLAFLFKVANMGSSPSNAIVAPNLTANWLATWRAGSPNDLWFAQASTDSTGALSCIAGRPLSVFNDGEPKAVDYVGGTANPQATTVSCAANPGNGTVEIDVPFSAVGVTPSSELFGLTGWTGNSSTALPSTVCATLDQNPGASPNNCVSPTGTVGFFNNVAETAPMDVLVSSGNQAVTPEAPVVPLLVGIGAAGVAGAAYLRRRRGRQAGL